MTRHGRGTPARYLGRERPSQSFSA